MLDSIIKTRSIVLAERGSISTIGFSIIVMLIILGVFLIDIAGAQLAARQLQTMADASALAASMKLNREFDGWAHSKRAAFMLLRNNQVFSDGGAIAIPDYFGVAVEDEDTIDEMEGGSPYQWRTYHIGNITLTIERGAYVTGDCGETYDFIPLESLDGQATTLVPRVPQHFCDPVLGCKVWEVANASRVTLQLKDVHSIFARALAFTDGGFSSIQRSAVSAKNDFFEVYPLPPGCTETP